MKLLILILSIPIILSCKKKTSKKIIVANTSVTNTINKPKKGFVIDSSKVKTKLATETPNYLTQIDGRQIQLPFNISLKHSKDTYRGSYTFNWKLCDLMIDSNLSNYNMYAFKDDIPYKGFSDTEGVLHIVKTIDSKAITISKFKKLHAENYTEIYYTDEESIIYGTGVGRIAVLYFKYNTNEKSFFVYYKENDSFGYRKSKKPTIKELIDIAIVQLRMAKNFAKNEIKRDSKSWGKYKKALHKIDKKVFSKIYKTILRSTDSIKEDIAFTPFINGNFELISLLKLSEESNLFWTALNNAPKNKKFDLSKLYNSSLLRQIGPLQTFSDENFFKLEYKDNSTIILKRDYTKPQYTVFKKTIINEKEFIMFTGGRMSTLINSKEMAYFYMSLFENYNDL